MPCGRPSKAVEVLTGLSCLLSSRTQQHPLWWGVGVAGEGGDGGGGVVGYPSLQRA